MASDPYIIMESSCYLFVCILGRGLGLLEEDIIDQTEPGEGMCAVCHATSSQTQDTIDHLSPGAKSQKRPRNGFLMTPSIHKV